MDHTVYIALGTNLGDRLVFANGIIVLAILSGLLIYIFNADTHSLIPLYAVGVFLSFTLSQSGLVRRWWRLRNPGWRISILINAFGTLVTGTVLVVVAYTKFLLGAWMVLVVMPAYNAAKTLRVTYEAIPKKDVDSVILVDDGSQDETLKIAKELNLEVFVHSRNYGYGGNQKTCYTEALKAEADIVVVETAVAHARRSHALSGVAALDCPHHSCLMFAALMTLAHLAISARMKRSKAAGDSLPATSAPSSTKRFLSAGSLSALSMARCRRSIACGGVLPGAHMPNHSGHHPRHAHQPGTGCPPAMLVTSRKKLLMGKTADKTELSLVDLYPVLLNIYPVQTIPTQIKK